MVRGRRRDIQSIHIHIAVGNVTAGDDAVAETRPELRIAPLNTSTTETARHATNSTTQKVVLKIPPLDLGTTAPMAVPPRIAITTPPPVMAMEPFQESIHNETEANVTSPTAPASTNETIPTAPTNASLDRPYCVAPVEEHHTNVDLPTKDASLHSTTTIPCPSFLAATDTSRPFTRECSPNCRPSCLTLMLDVTQWLSEHHELMSHCPPAANKGGTTCRARRNPIRNAACRRNHRRNNSSSSCHLEQATCHGPVLFDDVTAYLQHQQDTENSSSSTSPTNNATLPWWDSLEQCATIPADLADSAALRGHRIVAPLSTTSCSLDHGTNDQAGCFPSSSDGGTVSSTTSLPPTKLYFEYCNVVQDSWTTPCPDSDSSSCWKAVEPFPSGWTTFVVAASIPYNVSVAATNSTLCPNDDPVTSTLMPMLPSSAVTGVACFAQRIQLYYPPDSPDQPCPHCHACPLIGLGDMFGPLQVVGFGNSIQQHCTPCHERSTIRTSCPGAQNGTENHETAAFDCQALQQCHESVDCTTGTSLGLPAFSEPTCSFYRATRRNRTSDNGSGDDFVEEDAIGHDEVESDDDASSVSPSPSETLFPTSVNPPFDWNDTDDTESGDEASPVISNVTMPPMLFGNSTFGNSTTGPPPRGQTLDGVSTSVTGSPQTRSSLFHPLGWILVGASGLALLAVIAILAVLVVIRQRPESSPQRRSGNRRRTYNQSPLRRLQRPSIDEEIIYIHPIESTASEKRISKGDDDTLSDDASQTASEAAARGARFRNAVQETKRHSKRQERRTADGTNDAIYNMATQRSVVHFQSASILERPERDEVEAMYMTGTYHVPGP
jgi:hypothetical protein